jgi:hypothetical protein
LVFNQNEQIANDNKVIVASDKTDGLFEIVYTTSASATMCYDEFSGILSVDMGALSKIVTTDGGYTWGAEFFDDTTIEFTEDAMKIY